MEKRAQASIMRKEKQRDAENRYRRLFETAQDGIFILDAETGGITDANPMLLEILGCTGEALLGIRLWETRQFKGVMASHHFFEELQSHDTVRYEDLQLETNDGRHLDIDFTSHAYMVDHHRVIQCNIRDISERTRVEEALRESEQKLDRILQTILDGLVIIDLSGKIVYANRAAGAVLGIRKEDVVGRYFNNQDWRQIDEQGHPYPLEKLPLAIALREQKEVDMVEHPVIDPDGEIKWLSINAAPLFDESHKLYGAVASFRDITARKQTETTQDWLASFPEHNPSPVMEVDLNGNVYYLNPAAKRLLPDLQRLGKEHAWLSGLEEDFKAFRKGNISSTSRVVKIGTVAFQQEITYVAESKRIRIYGMDVSDRLQVEEALRQVLDELELRVQERTKELSRTNDQLRIESSNRKRLAQNLHDAINQSLFSAGLIAEVLPRLWDRDQAAARQSLEDLRRLTRGAQAELRAMLAELRPEVMAEADLSDLLRTLGNMLSGRANIPVSVSVKGKGTLPHEVQTAFYHLCQEAFTNIAKHAAASRAEIDLKYETGALSLHIHDNGRGFDTSQSVSADHFGLRMMRENAEAVGALLEVSSQPGLGTDIVIHWKEQPKKEVVKP